jgi:hypothetical protein
LVEDPAQLLEQTVAAPHGKGKKGLANKRASVMPVRNVRNLIAMGVAPDLSLANSVQVLGGLHHASDPGSPGGFGPVAAPASPSGLGPVPESPRAAIELSTLTLEASAPPILPVLSSSAPLMSSAASSSSPAASAHATSTVYTFLPQPAVSAVEPLPSAVAPVPVVAMDSRDSLTLAAAPVPISYQTFEPVAPIVLPSSDPNNPSSD